MIANTDDEIADVLDRLTWDANDLVLILYLIGRSPLYMTRNFMFHRSDSIDPFELNMPIDKTLLRKWLKGPHDQMRVDVVRPFLSSDRVMFRPDIES